MKLVCVCTNMHCQELIDVLQEDIDKYDPDGGDSEYFVVAKGHKINKKDETLVLKRKTYSIYKGLTPVMTSRIEEWDK